MSIQLLPKSNLLHTVINKTENKFIAFTKDLRESKKFTEREILTRILAVASPIFFLTMVIFKIVAGILDLGEGLAVSFKNRKWDTALFNQDRAKNYCKSLGWSLGGVIVGLPLGVINPTLLTKTPHAIFKTLCLDNSRPQVKTDALLLRPAQKHIDKIYDMFEGLDEVLGKHDILYTLCGGSLLGTVRHGGLIPWDDDGDIAIDSKDQAKLIAAAADLKAKGFVLVKNWCGYKICLLQGGTEQTKKGRFYDPDTQTWSEERFQTYPNIDIFAMDHDPEKGEYRISKDFPDSLATWPGELFTDQEWNSIDYVPFGHLKLKAVSKELAPAYCIRNYKKEYATIAKQWWDHEKEESFTTERKLTDFLITDFSYAAHSKIAGSIDHKRIAETALSQMSDQDMDVQWQLDKMFGSVRIINLTKDRQRLENVKQQLADIGLKEGQYSRFPGVLGSKLPSTTWERMQSNYKKIDTTTAEGKRKLDQQHMGQTGCYMSHYTLIKETAEKYEQARKTLIDLLNTPSTNADQIEAAREQVRKYSSVLIVEDDNSFGRILPQDAEEKERRNAVYSTTLTREGTGRIFYEAMRDLPEDWDMLYFMALPYTESTPTKSPHLLKLTHADCLNAYAVSARMYPRILNQLKRIEDPSQPFMPIDNELGELHGQTHSFVISPALAAQGAGSVINEVDDHQEKKRRYWQVDPSFKQVTV